MGDIHFGAPIQEVEWLKRKMGCEVFIEGGTFKGKTARKMATVFDSVFTIERHEKLHQEARARNPIHNITYLHGDTRAHLPQLLSQHQNCILWLDAHWSGQGTSGEDDECPLLSELEIVFTSSSRAAILIDDARLFIAPPPSPHKISAWPSIDEVIRATPQNYRVNIFNDVIYILEEEYFAPFQEYLQGVIDSP